MTQLTDVHVAPVAQEPLQMPSVASGASWVLKRLSTDNPFYVLSALLVLLGLWTSFGAQVRPEQTRALMIGLASYTLLLAVPACLLVRYGAVWDDMRTVLLLVVLMFLATSVTFDETLSRDPALGATCSVVGLVFAEVLSEVLLRAMRLKLPVGLRIPYHLALALFFLYPTAMLPYLDQPRSVELEWMLYGFGATAALVTLTLLPAARRGAEYVLENGSPWAWPFYPWALFVFLGVAVMGRSWLLCVSMQHVERTVPEMMIFGPYFLAPFLTAVALVVLELGIVSGSRGTSRVALMLPAAATALSTLGHRSDPLYQGFLADFQETLGASPLFLALVVSTLFYLIASLRGVRGGFGWLMIAIGAFCLVGPGSIRPEPLATAHAWPILVLAVIQGGIGLRRRSLDRCVLAVALLTAATWMGVWDARLAAGAAFHVALAGLIGLGIVFEGEAGRAFRSWGAGLASLAACTAATGVFDPGSAVPGWTYEVYPIGVAVALAGYGVLLHDRGPLAAAACAAVAWGTGLGWHVYASLRQTVVGLDAIALGLVLLVLAQLISAAKSGLIHRLRKGAGGVGSELP
ncbi:MAG: hypothetical protein U0835_05670 [Isosphaeraceae bacterium]